MYHLKKIGGKFYFYCRVPKDLVRLIGKKEIKKSLKTGDRQTAKTAVKSYSMELERLGVYTQFQTTLLTHAGYQPRKYL